MSLGTTWGTTPDERRLAFPCDDLLPGAGSAYYRGITIHMSADVVFRWICMLREASYSYLGPRGPEQLPLDLKTLGAGDRVMGVFTVAGFEEGRHVTIRLVFDTSEARRYALAVEDLAVSYFITARPNTTSVRLLVKLLVRYRRGPIGWLARLFVPWLDFVMTRRQLLTLKRCAEHSPTS